jgi:hypothetical protein
MGTPPRMSSPWMILVLAGLACPVLEAEPVEETGSLRGFVAGQESGCAYDNWQSRVSERIARPGYNVYAPPTLDPQLNGFGHYSNLPTGAAGDSLLTDFHRFFTHLLRGETGAADSLLTRMEQPALEWVRFQDTDSGHELHVLRERLDSTFVDPGLSPLPDDDVVGGFALGWGLFVFDPQAVRPEIVVQVPHPCDDYITPVIGLEVFQELGAGVLLIAGAGREVLFSGGTYNNSLSLSDPSRNCRHLFQKAHEALVDHWQQQGVDELVLQIHSYDDLAHRSLKSCVVSCGPWTRLALPPLYDAGNNGLGALNRVPQPALAADALGFPHGELTLQDYLSHGAPLALTVNGGLPDSTLSLAVSTSLLGYIGNCQLEYTVGYHGIGYPDCDRPERFLHIELDELPLPAHGLGEALFHNADSTRVADWSSFQRAWLTYRPLFQAIGEARDAWLAFAGGDAPTAPAAFAVLERGEDRVRLKWRPTLSSEHFSYEILLDTLGTPGEQSLIVDRSTVTNLCWAPLTSTWVEGLAQEVPYTAAIRARDLQGRVSALSNTLTFTLTELDPPLVEPIPGPLDVFWTRGDTLGVDLRVRDLEHRVNLASLQRRLDHNLDGSYSGTPEAWTGLGLSGLVADTTLRLDLVFAQAGPRMLFELRAQDDRSTVWGYSGHQLLAGSADDWFGVLDTLAPAPPQLLSATGTDLPGELCLRWQPLAPDSTAAGLRLFMADHAFTDPDDAQWMTDSHEHPELGLPGVDSLRIGGLPFGPGPLWLLADRLDHAGNVSQPSPPLSFEYEGGRGCRVQDLHLSLENGGLQLDWQVLCLGDGVQPELFRVYRLAQPWGGQPELLLETTETQAWLPLGPADRDFLRVTVSFQP